MKIIAGLSEIAAEYEAILCDVWGVVHNGREYFSAACEALARFRSNGGVVVLITNAPRPNSPVRAQLEGLGVPRSTFDDIVTSGDVTLTRIAAHGATPLHHIGPPRDLSLFEILERQTGLKPPLVPLEEAGYVVCTGLFDDRAETPDDYDASLSSMKSRNLEMISANPDLVVHVGDTLLYCSGAIAERYASIGGKVVQAGKPFGPIYEEALRLVEGRAGHAVERHKILAIGDGMPTDVKGARDFGLDCLFVASGIHRDDLLADAVLDKRAAAQLFDTVGATPTAMIADLVW